jgi:hypothetical protein
MTAVGFEPTPLRTGAWSQRLRPLGQTVFCTMWKMGNDISILLLLALSTVIHSSWKIGRRAPARPVKVCTPGRFTTSRNCLRTFQSPDPGNLDPFLDIVLHKTLPAGLEPATLRLTASRSNQLSYGSHASNAHGSTSNFCCRVD